MRRCATPTIWTSKSLERFLFYLFAAIVFSMHMCSDSEKAVLAPSVDIPKFYHRIAIHVSFMMAAFIALSTRASRTTRTSSQ